MRAVSVLSVADPTEWERLAAVFDLDACLGPHLDPCQRIAPPSFEKTVLPLLGDRVLVRFARRDAAKAAADRAARADTVARLPVRARRVLHSAQRHALEGVVAGLHAWDPEHDADAVRGRRWSRINAARCNEAKSFQAPASSASWRGLHGPSRRPGGR